MSLSDRMPIAGRLTHTLTDADGRVVEERRVKNLITLKGRAFLARSFAGLGATSVDMSMVLGTTAVAPALPVSAPEMEADAPPLLLLMMGASLTAVTVTATALVLENAPSLTWTVTL